MSIPGCEPNRDLVPVVGFDPLGYASLKSLMLIMIKLTAVGIARKKRPLPTPQNPVPKS
jgi:hypothetical protein